ncbi:hypothetical protein ACFC34_37530 [Streptomyces sp. NPDC056053]|uniref:hypothetical protein n=1 Tax=Streptomyces sp. NPDC056053 TaxID=3345696 RepID=UPI0035DB5097
MEPHHGMRRAGLETAERLAAHETYPVWLERIEVMGEGKVETAAGTWVLAPAGQRCGLWPIADAARAAGHRAEEHDASRIPSLACAPCWGRNRRPGS